MYRSPHVSPAGSELHDGACEACGVKIRRHRSSHRAVSSCFNEIQFLLTCRIPQRYAQNVCVSFLYTHVYHIVTSLRLPWCGHDPLVINPSKLIGVFN